VYLAGHPLLSDVGLIKAQLIAACPKLAEPVQCTTRKPGKEAPDPAVRVAKLPELEKLRAEGKVLTWRESGGEVFATTLPDAEALYKEQGKLAVVIISDAAALELVAAGPNPRHLILQVTPSETERYVRADARMADAERGDVDAALVAAATAAEDLRIARVATVLDDEVQLALADLRNHLAAALKHLFSRTPKPLIVGGPFASGKRRLLQRMLTLYPNGFALPPLYTTHPALEGPGYVHVEEAFIEELRRKGHLVHNERILGHSCALSYLDIRRHALAGFLVLKLQCGRKLTSRVHTGSQQRAASA